MTICLSTFMYCLFNIPSCDTNI
uniref:Uncharacterized protein n=1 Tax=Arundo donax TaxID=35708 RepID=A0A0A9C2N4_ARUDO